MTGSLSRVSEEKNPAALVEHQAEWAHRASRLLRDWLRESTDARQRYETVKRTLSVQQIGKADYDDYTLAKTEFFDQVQSEFEAWAANNH